MKKFVALVAVAALVAFAAPAFAANPFMDVPMNHWAYDAVSQLAARGIVTGYPDGAFKGEWKATRYEMASVVARALAYVDMNKASKEDLELLKRLVVEFKDELDALGVKVEDLDERVSVLEEDIGGWSFWGELRLDAKWGDNNGVNNPSAYGLTSDTDFDLNRYRIYMRKKVDDKVTFNARIGKSGDGDDIDWERYYVTVKMPWDSTAMIGKWNYDWEDEDGWYIDNDAWFTDQTPTGFYWSKPFATGQFDAFVAHMEGDELDPADEDTDYDTVEDSTYGDWGEGYYYGMRLKYAFNEKFGMGLVGIMKDYDEDYLGYANDWAVYWGQAYVNFTPNIQLRGRYMVQDLDKAVEVGGDTSTRTTDDPSALQAILEVDQEALGFTSLWIEYADIDEGFHIDTADPYADWGNNVLWADSANESNFQRDTSVLFVRADQAWTDKWGTFQRYIDVDDESENAEVFTVGVNYWYTPSIKFELSYDDTSYDKSEDDSMVRLRTHVWF